MNICHRIEIFLSLVLFDERNQTIGFTVFAEENLAFAIHDIGLEITSHHFTDAEILHGFWHLKAKFFSQTEIMVNRCERCEYHGSIVAKSNFLLTKLLS